MKALYRLTLTLILILLVLCTTATADTPTTNSISYLYAILIPSFALIVTVAAYYFDDQPLPSILASLLWFASSMFTTNIRFVGDFTVSNATYYVDLGNTEVGNLFIALGIIMGAWALLIILKASTNVGWLGGTKV